MFKTAFREFIRIPKQSFESAAGNTKDLSLLYIKNFWKSLVFTGDLVMCCNVEEKLVEINCLRAFQEFASAIEEVSSVESNLSGYSIFFCSLENSRIWKCFIRIFGIITWNTKDSFIFIFFNSKIYKHFRRNR